jgi:hypothetical protein
MLRVDLVNEVQANYTSNPILKTHPIIIQGFRNGSPRKSEAALAISEADGKKLLADLKAIFKKAKAKP